MYLSLRTANAAGMLLEQIVQIVVYGTLMLLEGTVEPWINKKL